MNRGTRIGRALARSHDKLRSIYLDGVCLTILSGDQQAYTTLATYDSHWYLDKREYSEVATGKKFKRLVVDDLNGCRLQHLRAMTAVQVGDVRYKFVSKDSFIGSVPSYEFKLQATGERV